MVKAEANCVHGQRGGKLRAWSTRRNIIPEVVADATASGFLGGGMEEKRSRSIPAYDVCGYDAEKRRLERGTMRMGGLWGKEMLDR